jgi:hypothetical protein
MFVVIRRYAAGARADEVARRVGEGLVPALRDLPGFRAYYAFVGEDGRPASVSIVDSRAAAVVANERAREWVAANMADLIPDPPEVTMGEMLVDAATFGEGAGQEAAASGGGAQEVPHDALD